MYLLTKKKKITYSSCKQIICFCNSGVGRMSIEHVYISIRSCQTSNLNCMDFPVYLQVPALNTNYSASYLLPRPVHHDYCQVHGRNCAVLRPPSRPLSWWMSCGTDHRLCRVSIDGAAEFHTVPVTVGFLACLAFSNITFVESCATGGPLSMLSQVLPFWSPGHILRWKHLKDPAGLLPFARAVLRRTAPGLYHEVCMRHTILSRMSNSHRKPSSFSVFSIDVFTFAERVGHCVAASDCISSNQLWASGAANSAHVALSLWERVFYCILPLRKT